MSSSNPKPKPWKRGDEEFYTPRSPALRRKIAFVAKADEFIRKWTKMGLRGGSQYDSNPVTHDAGVELKRGNCGEAAKLLTLAKEGSYEEDIDAEDPKIVKQMERALKRVCQKRNVK